MKKILSFVLAFVAMLSLLLLAGCSDGSENITSEHQEKIDKLEEETKELEKQNKDLAALLNESQKTNSELLDELKKSNSELAELQKIAKDLKDHISKNYERISLTLDNYEKYININIAYGSCVADYIGTDSLGTRSYLLSCIGTITTQKKCECYFDHVSIFYDVNITGWKTNATDPIVTLGYNGESSGSFFIQTTASDLTFSFPTSHYYDISINSIFGDVLVPKEA